VSVPEPSETTEKKPQLADPNPVLDRILLGVVGLFIVYLLVQLVCFQYGRDQGIYAVVADSLVHGHAPYRDSWDFKPPGIYFVFALSRLFGRSMHAVRVLEALGFASMVWSFGILSKRFVGDFRAGVVAAAIAILTHVQLEFWHTAQPESFGAIALSWALVCSVYEPEMTTPNDATARNKQWLSWAGAGALFTVGALLKPPLGGGFVLCLAFLCWYRYRTLGLAVRKAIVPPLVSYAVGAVFPLLGTILYFVAKGAWPHLYHTLFVFTPGYTKVTFQQEALWRGFYYAIIESIIQFSAFFPLGLILFACLPATTERERFFGWQVWMFILLLCFGVALQAKFFPYHYGSALPLLSLLAGWGFWKLWLRVRSQATGLTLLLLGAYALTQAKPWSPNLSKTFWQRNEMRIDALFDSGLRTKTNDELHSVADVNAKANREVAAWIASHTQPTDLVYIWGFEPVIYYLAQRNSPSRFIYNVPQRVSWAQTWSRQELMRDLRKTPAKILVVEHRDVFPVVTNNNLDSADTMTRFWDLHNLVETQYRWVTSIEDFDIYQHVEQTIPHNNAP
jgi:hypothetical protein